MTRSRVCWWSSIICGCICGWTWRANIIISELLARVIIYLSNHCAIWCNHSGANDSSNWIWRWITCCPWIWVRSISCCCSRHWCWRSWIRYTCWSRLILTRYISSSVCSNNIRPLLRRISRWINCIWGCSWLIIWSWWCIRTILTWDISYRLRVRRVRIISIWIGWIVWWSTNGYFSSTFSYMIKVFSINHWFLTFLTSLSSCLALLLVILVFVSWDRHLAICTFDWFC